MFKAQGDIISAVIIIVIALSLFSTAYMWGMPLIQKRQDEAKVERVYSYFNVANANSIIKRMEYIANNGGTETFATDIDGIWFLKEYDVGELESNYIEFTFLSKVSNVAAGVGWVTLTPGTECPDTGAPGSGIVGIDASTVVCAKAESHADGYNITYRVWFRELDEATDAKGYRINLARRAGDPYSSTGRTVRISREDVYTETEDGKTLSITKIKILLE